MRVVIANPYFPPYSPGGAEHSLEQMCRRFIDRDIKVNVVTNSFNGKTYQTESSGCIIDFIESPLSIRQGHTIDTSLYIWSSSYRNRLCKVLIDKCRKRDNLILIANNTACYIPVARIGKLTGSPTIGIIRDSHVICEIGSCIESKPGEKAVACRGILGASKCMLRFQRDRGVSGLRPVPGVLFNGIMRGIQRRSLRLNGIKNLKIIVAISETLKNLLLRNVKNIKQNMLVIPNFHTEIECADEHAFDKYASSLGLQRKNYFLVAGKKSYGKGTDIGEIAGEIVSEKYPGFKTLFVGKGNLILNKKPEICIDSKPVNQPLLIRLLKNSIALIVPGRCQEGLHRTMVDAVKHTIPIICTNAGGVKEGVIEGKNGYIVNSNDSISIANAMMKILSWTKREFEQSNITSNSIFNSKFLDNIIMQKWNQLFQSILH